MASVATASDGKPKRTPGLVGESKYYNLLLQFAHLHHIFDADHVQRAFPHHFKSRRDARRHLDTLVERDHLHKKEEDRNIYNILIGGFDRCRDIKEINKATIPDDYKLPKGVQAEHDLLVTDTAVDVYELCEARKDVKLHWQERYGFHVWPAFEHLHPDWSDFLQARDDVCFGVWEMIVGEGSATRMRQKLLGYARWYETEATQQFLAWVYSLVEVALPISKTTGRPIYPIRIYCIVKSNDKRMTDAAKERMLLGQTFFLPADMQQFVWTAPSDVLDQETVNGPVWHCARDLVPYRDKWKGAQKRRHGRFVEEIMSELPTYPLVPDAT